MPQDCIVQGPIRQSTINVAGSSSCPDQNARCRCQSRWSRAACAVGQHIDNRLCFFQPTMNADFMAWVGNEQGTFAERIHAGCPFWIIPAQRADGFSRRDKVLTSPILWELS